MQFLNAAVKVFLVIELMLSIMMFLPSAMAVEEQPWVKFAGNPVLSPTPGGWDSDFVVQPRVFYDEHTYRMWYVGGKQGAIAIGYAVSVGVENPNIIIGNLGFMLFHDGIGEAIAGSIGLTQPPMGFQIPEFTPSLLGVLVGVTLLVTISLVKLDNRRKN